jgi:hypothetical protein
VKAVLDACVLVPPVLRECLLAVAAAGLYPPLWSDRILGEWLHAAARHGRLGRRGAAWPRSAGQCRLSGRAMVRLQPGVEARLYAAR